MANYLKGKFVSPPLPPPPPPPTHTHTHTHTQILLTCNAVTLHCMCMKLGRNFACSCYFSLSLSSVPVHILWPPAPRRSPRVLTVQQELESCCCWGWSLTSEAPPTPISWLCWTTSWWSTEPFATDRLRREAISS